MFLIALREPLRTTVVVVDFTGKTLDDIIDRVLRLDSAQTSHSMSMTALQRALPIEEEMRFRKAVYVQPASILDTPPWNASYDRTSRSVIRGRTH